MTDDIDIASPKSAATRPWAAPALKLLLGVVYGEDKEWRALREHEAAVREHFASLGLELVVDEGEAFAWLSQREAGEDEEALPRLLRRMPLTWEQTLLCVLLRERLLQFDRSGDPDGRLVLAIEDLRELLAPFLREENDAKKFERRLAGLLNKAEELGFLRRFESPSGVRYEVKRILKARLPVLDLERILDKVMAWRDAGEE